jgi:hypothetical protein
MKSKTNYFMAVQINSNASTQFLQATLESNWKR